MSPTPSGAATASRAQRGGRKIGKLIGGMPQLRSPVRTERAVGCGHPMQSAFHNGRVPECEIKGCQGKVAIYDWSKQHAVCGGQHPKEEDARRVHQLHVHSGVPDMPSAVEDPHNERGLAELEVLRGRVAGPVQGHGDQCALDVTLSREHGVHPSTSEHNVGELRNRIPHD
eukprot:CAMPEP_0179017996 /NCGR_PEP_ID=MMETSP0796-20121207/4126_1 /TAXON_ID=73915 /ORGANISM="Pyrodinium bahamense, Strain pbaha01" /LENGTH=170 /DNA_ID=CAMNT_0020713741 /DNA_START=308 /DNA_END=821 /DNA_ORIENTATION=-